MNPTIHILHVIEKSIPFIPGKQNINEEEISNSLETEAKKHLSVLTREIENESDVKVSGVIRHGIDYEEITNFANEIQTDLIVIATHGRTGIMHSLLGSVAEKVIQHSKCPVLVIPSREER